MTLVASNTQPRTRLWVPTLPTLQTTNIQHSKEALSHVFVDGVSAPDAQNTPAKPSKPLLSFLAPTSIALTPLLPYYICQTKYQARPITAP